MFICQRRAVSLTGAEDSESCENRNGAASALLHIDESDGVDEINRQRNKTRRRSEPRQVQTGENSTNQTQTSQACLDKNEDLSSLLLGLNSRRDDESSGSVIFSNN